MSFRTRFAPSPTGPLHLGHAYSALLAYDLAKAQAGTFLLRIEDIDQSRARTDWERQIYDDLNWLGITWPSPVMRQSDRQGAYNNAKNKLWRMGLLYPCVCTRRDIRNALSAPQETTDQIGPDGLIYPGTCRENPVLRETFMRDPLAPSDVTLRLDMGMACSVSGVFDRKDQASFSETGSGPDRETGDIRFTPQEMRAAVGDAVLARRDMGTSYHLSVVVDDAAQGISHVVRGQDLFEATKIHVVLQKLLDLPTPIYHHHRLIRDEHGKRLAKRDDARAISLFRDEGASPADIRAMVGL